MRALLFTIPEPEAEDRDRRAIRATGRSCSVRSRCRAPGVPDVRLALFVGAPVLTRSGLGTRGAQRRTEAGSAVRLAKQWSGQRARRSFASSMRRRPNPRDRSSRARCETARPSCPRGPSSPRPVPVGPPRPTSPVTRRMSSVASQLRTSSSGCPGSKSKVARHDDSHTSPMPSAYRPATARDGLTPRGPHQERRSRRPSAPRQVVASARRGSHGHVPAARSCAGQRRTSRSRTRDGGEDLALPAPYETTRTLRAAFRHDRGVEGHPGHVGLPRLGAGISSAQSGESKAAEPGNTDRT